MQQDQKNGRGAGSSPWKMINSKSGSYFDPRLVVRFVKLEADLKRIVQTIGLL
jgi:response regulator RpfG family c-di-GMP phosphodiesterase